MCNPDSVNITKNRLETCISDIMQWLSHSSLKCNDAKTEFMFICKANQAPDCADLKVGMSQIAVKKHVKNLGVILDSNMNMSKFIT